MNGCGQQELKSISNHENCMVSESCYSAHILCHLLVFSLVLFFASFVRKR